MIVQVRGWYKIRVEETNCAFLVYLVKFCSYRPTKKPSNLLLAFTMHAHLLIYSRMYIMPSK